MKQILEIAADLVPLETGLETITASGDDLEKKNQIKSLKKDFDLILKEKKLEKNYLIWSWF